jgi:hypothetical protein
MNMLDILELIRKRAVIPVSQRLETELKYIILNSEDYLDLEFATSEENIHPPHVGTEELEAIFQAEKLSNSVKESLQLNHISPHSKVEKTFQACVICTAWNPQTCILI